MAAHSEFALVESTKMEAAPAPKSSKKSTRVVQTRKAAKQRPSKKKEKKKAKAKPAECNIVPVMKLRAVDIVDDRDAMAPGQSIAQEDKAETAAEDRTDVIQLPHPGSPEISGGPTDTGAGLADILPDPDLEAAAPIENGIEPLATDPELLELLEKLSTTIDTANTVLDATSGLSAEDIADSNPKPEPSPQPETEPDDPPPLAAEFTEPAPAEAPGRRRTFGFVVNAAIAGLILAAGSAWLTYTNPWLLNGKPEAPAEPEQTVSAAPVEVENQSAPSDKVLKSVAAAPRTTLASFAPPEDDPVPMETAIPDAPLPAAKVSRHIRVAAGQSVPLVVSLPAAPDQGEISVMIQEVPDRVELSAGKSLGAGNWLLDEAQLDNLTLNTTKRITPGDYQLEVIFVRSDGKVPETRKVSLTVEPAAKKAPAKVAGQTPETKSPEAGKSKATIARAGVAIEIPVAPAKRTEAAPIKQASISEAPQKAALPVKPATIAAPPPKDLLSVKEIETILIRGRTLLNDGDIAGARLLLEYAAEHGSKMAMVKLGESYDPKYLALLGARGVHSDVDQAARWYNRASAAR